MKDPTYPVHTTINVEQIADYVKFDNELRTAPPNVNIDAIPIGFAEFSNIWNNNVTERDPRRFSIVTLCDDPKENSFQPSTHPVRLHEFHLPPLPPVNPPSYKANAPKTSPQPHPTVASEQANIEHEFAVLMAAKQRDERQAVGSEKQPTYQKGKQSQAQPRNFHPYSKDSGRRNGKQTKNAPPKRAQSTSRVYLPHLSSQESPAANNQASIGVQEETTVAGPSNAPPAVGIATSVPEGSDQHVPMETAN
jgi:hypothetical protein